MKIATPPRLIVLLVAALGLAAITSNARGDGGVVIDQAESGPYRVTVFASQLRAGPTDLSVMVQNATTNESVLDAKVEFALEAQASVDPATPQSAWVPPCCSMELKTDLAAIPATREAAQNKLLYAALTTLPASGDYLLTTTVTTGTGAARLTTPLRVAPPLSPASTYWPLLALPPVAIFGFILRAHAKRRPGA